MYNVTYENRPLTKARSSNDYGAIVEWSNEVVTKIEPTGSGVHKFANESPQQIKVVPYGAGNPFSTFWMRVHCWSVTGQTPTWIWMRSTVGMIGCTLSVLPELAGIDDCVIGPIERFGGSEAGVQYVILALPPCQKIEFEFLNATPKAQVGMNALWASA